MDGRVTSPTWGPPPPCKKGLKGPAEWCVMKLVFPRYYSPRTLSTVLLLNKFSLQDPISPHYHKTPFPWLSVVF